MSLATISGKIKYSKPSHQVRLSGFRLLLVAIYFFILFCGKDQLCQEESGGLKQMLPQLSLALAAAVGIPQQVFSRGCSRAVPLAPVEQEADGPSVLLREGSNTWCLAATSATCNDNLSNPAPFYLLFLEERQLRSRVKLYPELPFSLIALESEWMGQLKRAFGRPGAQESMATCREIELSVWKNRYGTDLPSSTWVCIFNCLVKVPLFCVLFLILI